MRLHYVRSNMPLREEDRIMEPDEPSPDQDANPRPIKPSYPNKPTKLSPSKQDLRMKALAEIQLRKEWSSSPLF